eukprot:5763705-Amphidinium_carterae.2
MLTSREGFWAVRTLQQSVDTIALRSPTDITRHSVNEPSASEGVGLDVMEGPFQLVVPSHHEVQDFAGVVS